MSLVPVSYNDYPHDLYELHKPNSIGNWEIRKVILQKGTELQFYNQKNGMTKCNFITPYKSVQLRQLKANIWMSDTPFEYETNRKAISVATGDVLECGLGLGLFTYYASKKQGVKTITIVEKAQPVIDLVYHKIKNKKTNIIKDDAISFLKSTKQKFDTIHIDIWADIVPYKEMESVIKIAKQRLRPNGMVVCWLDEFLKRVMKEIKNGARDSRGIGIFPPCITCGKTLRHDYGGFCMDCADGLGISEIFLRRNSIANIRHG
jgi:2-polyprenyl-3-methyl-5-hydroxy-6-metoxy-1,4-benzoquinol methylase